MRLFRVVLRTVTAHSVIVQAEEEDSLRDIADAAISAFDEKLAVLSDDDGPEVIELAELPVNSGIAPTYDSTGRAVSPAWAQDPSAG